MIVTLAMTTGMRRGEILALEWEHINLDNGKIHVHQTLTYTKEKGHVFKTPKTKNLIRTISLSKGVTEQLKRYKQYKLRERLKLGEKWEGGDHFFLFTAELGKPMHSSSVTSWWRKRLKNTTYLKLRFMKYDIHHNAFNKSGSPYENN